MQALRHSICHQLVLVYYKFSGGTSGPEGLYAKNLAQWGKILKSVYPTIF